jgi:hypothetical protein
MSVGNIINKLLENTSLYFATPVIVNTSESTDRFDLYMCRIGIRLQVIYVLVPETSDTATDLEYFRISDLKWSSIHFRSYSNEESFLNAFHHISPSDIPTSYTSDITDDIEDVNLVAADDTQYDRKIYLPDNNEAYKITLLSQKTTKDMGNNLPDKTTLVPAIMEFSTIIEAL